ncbi:integrase family protein [Flavobacterium sp. MXW15]|uniref:Integrase family protein n=1 Tax=Xanthomonas chitinilytica TaxID=2989819 RepID=A0ABT3JVQ1_9XANT|nr:integrase family protein [Xanthomonas sp. H13-6]MCW4454816.1 integrase family protein [Flavobacterium sp. MXW15]MCW4472556.1 integrase family protein [Xanthomonas sp. H13-6]
MAKVALKKYRLTQAQLRSLTIAKWPELDQQGNVVIVSNPTGKPYRFVDGTPGAPVGFGFYVGPMGAFYELRIQHNGVRRRLALGSVQELTLARAHELAGAQRHHIRHTGEDPRERVRTEAARQKARGKTVGEALEDYIAHLEDRLARGRAKAGGVEGVKDALARLQRPEVNLADKAIAALTAKDLLAAWNGLRHTCMLQSNRLSPGTKAFLTKQGEWWNLKLEDLVRLGLTGKTLARAHAAGLSATEQTMGNASRAVARAIKAERVAAANAGRQPALVHNPFEALADDERYRSSKELAKHYSAAKVRNPLGTDDSATGSQTLPTVLKALVGRRDMQSGHNAVGVDYVLLTLLWGTRRSEAAKLRRYESCSPDELDLRLASWAWLAPRPNAKNPTTGLRGSQVFLHDTKNGQFQLLPVAYFAERILRWRFDDSVMKERALTKALAQAQREKDAKKIAHIQWQLKNLARWVFPARNPKSKEGHHTDSKAILHNVRLDAGLLDPERGIDIGLTPHDLRRTLGRFAGKLLPGHVVSQLLNHHTDRDDTGKMAKVTERYSEQEWPALQEAMAKVEEAIISTSPRVWNILKGPDKQMLDEHRDPPLKLPSRRALGYRSKAHTAGSQSRASQAPGGG